MPNDKGKERGPQCALAVFTFGILTFAFLRAFISVPKTQPRHGLDRHYFKALRFCFLTEPLLFFGEEGI